MKDKIRAAANYFTRGEKLLWLSSVCIIILTYIIFRSGSPLSLTASLVGVTSLIFCAKGNPLGQALMIIFSLLYGIISYSFAYYGEMLTYLGMTLPMAVISLVSWLKNPYEGKRSEVAVSRLRRADCAAMLLLTAAVTAVFYFLLKHFNTANLIPSTISVTTSFAAVFLCFRRSPYFAAAYAANDAVLIVLWAAASVKNFSYIAMVICFAIFLANDIYGFVNWRRMAKRQLGAREI